MHELAQKDFENLRQDSDDDEPEPKIVRRGRPPGKKVKKSIESSPVECVGPESFSDATLGSWGENANGSNSYNLRKARNTSMLRPSDAVVNGVLHRSLSGETCTSWMSEWENEFPGRAYGPICLSLYICYLLLIAIGSIPCLHLVMRNLS